MERRQSQISGAGACDTCRIKKAKCSRDRPSCLACIRAGTQCCYSGKTARSPLTRIHLSSVEKRARDLEILFSQLHPDMSLDSALDSISGGQPLTPGDILPANPPAMVQVEDTSSVPQVGIDSDLVSEAAPDQDEGYDWAEDQVSTDRLADGMAALRVEPSGTGYLGATSGVVFLRALLIWINDPELLDRSLLRTGGFAGQSPMYDLASSQLAESTLSGQVKNRLLDAFFASYHLSYPFVHEATFRAQYHEIIPRPQRGSWDMLFSTILALGSWSSGDGPTEIDERLYRRATSLGKDESMFETANLTMVQALVLLSNLSQKRNRPNTGWNFLGLAARMALSLGLHREHPSWNISPLQQEMRRRVWWGLYIHDSGSSTTFGRAIMLPDRKSMDCRPVSNIDDELLTPRTHDFPEESLEPTIYSGLKAQAEFHLESNYISNSLVLNGRLPMDEALALSVRLDMWTARLPAYFQLNQELASSEQWYIYARARIWWRFWNLKMILLRQILLRKAMNSQERSQGHRFLEAEDACCRACLESAHLTIESINHFLHNAEVTKLVGWYSTYFLFHAALVALIPMLNGFTPSQADGARADIEVAMALFQGVLAKTSLAPQCAEVIHRLISKAPAFRGLQPDDGNLATGYMPPEWQAAPEDFFNVMGWDSMSQQF